MVRRQLKSPSHFSPDSERDEHGKRSRGLKDPYPLDLTGTRDAILIMADTTVSEFI